MDTGFSLTNKSLSTDVLAYNAMHLRDQQAFLVRDGDRSHCYSWHSIFCFVLSCKEWLTTGGVRPGDRVAWQLPNSIEWITLELACNWIGAISCPMDSRVPTETVKRLVQLVDPVLFLSKSNLRGDKLHSTPPPAIEFFSKVDSHLADQAARNLWSEGAVPPASSSAATLLFTSGTTGDTPKAVALSHSNLMLNASAKLKAMPQYSTDHRINILPFAHAYARTCELTAWLLSGSSMECVQSIPELLGRLPTSQATLLNAVPLVFQKIHDQWQKSGGKTEALRQQLGPAMRQLASGGAPIAEELRDRFLSAGYPIFQGYGLTETGPVVCSNVNKTLASQNYLSDKHCLSGVGPPVEGMEIRVDEDSNLYVRGTGVMLGYWNDSQATAARFHDLDGSGNANWFSTGDLASISPLDESIQILGRSDETIILTNGYKLHPLAIESKIKALNGIQDCIVLPTTEGRWQVLLQIDGQSTARTDVEWQSCIKELCSEEIRSSLARVQLHASPWTSESGLLNFKGGKRRQEFLNRFMH